MIYPQCRTCVTAWLLGCWMGLDITSFQSHPHLIKEWYEVGTMKSSGNKNVVETLSALHRKLDTKFGKENPLKYTLNAIHSETPSLCISCGDDALLTNLDDIVYLEGTEKNLKVHLKCSSGSFACMTMKLCRSNSSTDRRTKNSRYLAQSQTGGSDVEAELERK